MSSLRFKIDFRLPETLIKMAVILFQDLLERVEALTTISNLWETAETRRVNRACT